MDETLRLECNECNEVTIYIIDHRSSFVSSGSFTRYVIFLMAVIVRNVRRVKKEKRKERGINENKGKLKEERRK